jgi:hypothetical protein
LILEILELNGLIEMNGSGLADKGWEIADG